MAWETRERGGLYYTRSRKENGRVVREYIGGGVLGELVARTDVLAALQREEEAAALRAEREETARLEEPLKELCEISELLAHAVLVCSGYHQHHGEWRLRREPK